MAAYTQQTPTVSNILFNAPADVFVGSTPTFVGATHGETVVEAQREYQDIEVEQFIGPIELGLTGESCTIKFNVAEVTLANYQRALASGSGTGFGSNSAETPQQWQLKSKGIGSTTRTVTIHKAVVEGTKLSYKKDELQMVEFSLKCCKDTAKVDGDQFFSITEA